MDETALRVALDDELRARHVEAPDHRCVQDADVWPCDFIRADDERRRLVAVVEAARKLPEWLMEHEATDALRAALDEVKPDGDL